MSWRSRTHDGAVGEADAHLSLQPSDDVLRLQPLARHQHLRYQITTRGGHQSCASHFTLLAVPYTRISRRSSNSKTERQELTP